MLLVGQYVQNITNHRALYSYIAEYLYPCQVRLDVYYAESNVF